MKVLSFFLATGTTLTFFHNSGNIPFFNDSSNMVFKGIVTDSLQIFTIPCDLLESNEFSTDNIRSFETGKELILVLVLYKMGGRTLLFFINVHIVAKKVLKRFAFSQQKPTGQY